MHICFINFSSYQLFADPATRPDAVGHYGIMGPAFLMRDTLDVSVITEDCGQPRIERRNGITIYASVNTASHNHVRNMGRLLRAFWAANADVYITSIFGKEIFFIWLFCKLRRKKFIYQTAHDWECDRTNINRSKIWGTLFCIALEHADEIVAITNTHIRLLRQHHPAITSPITYIPYQASAEIATASPTREYVLWIARCIPWKNPLLFVELAREFPNERFVMIAAPDPAHQVLLKQVQDAARRLPNMTFIPGVKNSETHNYFRHAKVFVNTSDTEGFPYTLLESGYSHTPFLSLHINPDECITKFSIGYCAHGNTDRMRYYLHTLLTNHDDWTQRSKSIHTYTQTNHNPKNIQKQWTLVLRHALQTS